MESTTHRTAERRPDPVLERIQREHELISAYRAAKTLEERLELAGLEDLVQTIRGVRDAIHAAFNVDMQEKNVLVGGPPCQPFRSDAGGSSS